ncbi:MAG: acylneuraminate cytidylyltransferase family protein [Methanofastidiosum sp.]|jgi:CMP-N-acetylneuraminic acid synthetase
MYKGHKIIALIPAKGNSTRLPNKNIKLMFGKPLVAWSIESALESKYLDGIYVSTDSSVIKEIAIKYGVSVIDRPKELCTADSHIKETLKHTAEIVDTDFILLMNPTSPLRYNIDIFLDQFDPEKYDTAASVEECKKYPWGSTDEANMQSLELFYYDTGSLYIHKCDYILDGKYWCPDKDRRQPIVTPQYMNYEIDNDLDWAIVEMLFQKYYILYWRI